MANTTKEYCRKGDLIGIKGRLDSLWQNNRIVVVADKVTFLATKKTEQENDLGKGEI
jgi:single-stranded DNA-binding protein